jgi:pimeloyl-ACP methyl ester carboxylesterase
VQAQSRGFTINYEVRGDGPPLVLVPGTLSSAAQWELFGYVETLCDIYRVVSVDPLGHGRSDKPHDPDAYAAAGVTADLLAVLDAEMSTGRASGATPAAAGSRIGSPPSTRSVCSE